MFVIRSMGWDGQCEGHNKTVMTIKNQLQKSNLLATSNPEMGMKGWHFKLFFVQKLPFVITKITLLQKIHPLLSHSFTALFGGTIIFVEAFSQWKCSWFLIVTTVLQWPHIGDGYLWLELGLNNEFLALFGSIMVIKRIWHGV